MIRRTCSVDGCGRKHYGRGYCANHWTLWHKYGTHQGKLDRRATSLKWLIDHTGHQSDECLDWPFNISRKYGRLSVNNRLWPAHRYMCFLVHGEPPFEDAQAAHRCGRHSCVNPRHLRWATAVENAADKFIHGTMLRGEKHGFSHITESQVREVRRRSSEGEAKKAIARSLGMNRATVQDILKGKSWGWLDA